LASEIRKLVIPAAGLGTRSLPATKAIPKEMLPINGKPLIQLTVEEAVASGIETIILIVGRGKDLLAEHFRRNIHLETLLRTRGQNADADAVRDIAELAEIRIVEQGDPRGLAHAVTCARSQVGDEPFAVILPDAVIDSDVPAIRQLIDCYSKHQGCIIATQVVRADEVERFGMLDVIPFPDSCCGDRTMRVESLTERPSIGTVSSCHGIFGRYILLPEIFSCIERLAPGRGGEFQLTDALQLYARQKPLYAYRFQGKHYDAGSKLGFLQATFAYALKDPAVAGRLKEQVAEIEIAAACKA
jgi:UTP--glucose-1-phosphate uridylyltransferase